MNNQEKELILLKDLGMLYPKETSKQKTRYGIYKCECGNEFKAQVKSVKEGNTQSCGCYKKQRLTILNTNHNLTNHRLYKTWNGMVQRCNNKKQKSYINYGGRGITVCTEWLDINNFINDMYPTFKEGLTLDRINPNGNYEKSNCRWATNTIQSRNRKAIQKNNNSGYKGVHFNNAEKVWKSQIKINSKVVYIGRYKTAIEAAKAYDNYIICNNLEHTKNF